MDVKVAVEFLKEINIGSASGYGNAYIPTNHNISEVIELLQQGEALKAENTELKAYKQMWEKLEHGVVYDDEGNYTYSWSGKLIGHMHRIKRDLEQKYFPKEERLNETQVE